MTTKWFKQWLMQSDSPGANTRSKRREGNNIDETTNERRNSWKHMNRARTRWSAVRKLAGPREIRVISKGQRGRSWCKGHGSPQIWREGRVCQRSRGAIVRRDRRTAFFFFQAEDGIRDLIVTGVQTCALPI